MAVTLDTYAPFDDGPGADALEATWRKMFSRVLSDGVFRGVANAFKVYADSTGLQVKVQTGECWIAGHWGESTAEKVLPIQANALGLTRADRIILRNHFGDNRIELDVLTGTSGTPTAVTSNTTLREISLATLLVPNGDTTIADDQLTDDRTYAVAPVADRVVAGAVAETAGVINSAVTTTETTVTKLNLTGVSQELGRTYLLNLNLFANFTQPGELYRIRVRQDTALSGTVLAEWTWTTDLGNDDHRSFAQPYKATASGTVSLYVSVQRVVAAGSPGNMSVYGFSRTAFWVERTSNSWSYVA